MAGGRGAPGRRGGPRGKATSKNARVPAGSAGVPAKEIHRLTGLDQMKVLADPLRIRILELLCEERTAKQVAEILGQPPTRLYHHVAALERVGLIRLARTRQRRGATEKYYLAVARTFSADSRLFSSAPRAQVRETAQGVATQVLENTATDLRALLDHGEGAKALAQEVILSYLEVRGSEKELKAVRARLMKLIKSLAGESKSGPSGTGYRLTIAFFPLADRRRST